MPEEIKTPGTTEEATVVASPVVAPAAEEAVKTLDNANAEGANSVA